jgi:hypothetical protein
MENPLLGTWRLVAMERRARDGEISYPFGPAPVGHLTYSADGHMSAIITPAGRPAPSSGNLREASEAEKLAIFEGCTAYAGACEFLGDRVVHHVEVSLNPSLVGTDQVRLVELDGDRLVLIPPARTVNGEAVTTRVSWVRAAGPT